MASSIIFLRKDAPIGGSNRQNAKRATSANSAAELLQGVAPVALIDLRRSFRTIENIAGRRRPRCLQLQIDYTAATYAAGLDLLGQW